MRIRNAEDLTRHLQPGITAESIELEFKRTVGDYGARLEEARSEFARDVSAFANTIGGCILVGVEENSGAERSVAVALRPVIDPDAEIAWMESAIRNYLVP